MIKVSNKSGRLQVFNLPHDVMCVSECSCTDHEHRQVDHNPKTGERGVRILARKLSASAHVQPGTFVNLPDEAKNAPEIISAQNRGDVTIEQTGESANV